MARYQFTVEDRRKGGKTQPREAKVQGGQKGFEVTLERHPWMWKRLMYAPGMKRFDPEKFCPKKGED